MGRFKLTLKAKADLINIGRYTQNQWGIRQRNKYLASLDAGCTNAVAGKEFAARPKPGYLSYKEGSHVIFYRRANEEIKIIGILYERMDFEQAFMNGTA